MNRLSAGIALLLLAACAPPPPAPVFEADGLAVEEKPEPKPDRPDFHRIQEGETLAGIALQHGLDYKELALWNGLSNPNSIYAGDVLRLSAPETAAVAAPVKAVRTPELGVTPQLAPPPEIEPAPSAASKNAPVKDSPAAAKYAYSKKTLKKLQAEYAAAVPAPKPVVPVAADIPQTAAPAAPGAPKESRRRFGVDWSWPAQGKVVQKFNEASKGLDIAGKKGGGVFAAADGKVVYVGSGVKSYGRLIIVKHKNDYLSAYAHNDKILVREGARVSRGKQIATIGDSGASRVMLHLEIRKAGKPLDPLQVLPQKP